MTVKKILWSLKAPQFGNILTVGDSAKIGTISAFILYIKKDIVKKLMIIIQYSLSLNNML